MLHESIKKCIIFNFSFILFFLLYPLSPAAAGQGNNYFL